MHEQHSQPLFGEICHVGGGRCCCADNYSRERWCRKSVWSGFITALLCLCFKPSWWGRVLWGPEVRTSISTPPQALVWPPHQKNPPKNRNADSVYAGGSDTSQSFNEGIVPIMSWWAALLTHKLSALLRVYQQPGSAVGSCGLSKSGMRLPESCQSASLAAKGSQWTKQPDWWIN